jgi:hypothetical protein
MKLRIVRLSTMIATMLGLLLAALCLPNVAVADESGSHEHEHEFGLSLFSFVKPLGICALGSALVTFGTGLARRKLGRRFLKVHKIFAWLTVGFALCHASLVLALF